MTQPARQHARNGGFVAPGRVMIAIAVILTGFATILAVNRSSVGAATRPDGNDRLVNDRMDGGAGTDMCQRGNGTDTLVSC